MEPMEPPMERRVKTWALTSLAEEVPTSQRVLMLPPQGLLRSRLRPSLTGRALPWLWLP